MKITIIILLIFNILFTLWIYSKEINNNIQQNTRIKALEIKQLDIDKNIEDKELIVDAVLEISKRLETIIKVYDENVEIYNKKLKEHWDKIQAIINYLK